jgi:hypothetical protein
MMEKLTDYKLKSSLTMTDTWMKAKLISLSILNLMSPSLIDAIKISGNI